MLVPARSRAQPFDRQGLADLSRWRPWTSATGQLLSDRPVSITHMHGLRDLNGKMDAPERLRQAHRLLDISRRVSQSDDVTVICGDFNVEPDSETLNLIRQEGFTELVTDRGFEGTRNSQYHKPGRFADYPFINKHVEVIDFQVVSDPEVSDHRPLVLRI